jgi:hypothetical protein
MPFLAAISPALLFFLFGGIILFVVTSAAKHNKAVNEAWKSAGTRLGLRYTQVSRKRKLEGTYRGFTVRVNTFTQNSGNSSQTFTRFRISYPSLGLGLELKHQHFFATLGRALTGGKDIVVGDQEFDDTVIVEGHSASNVIEFLTPDRRRAIMALIASKRRGQIQDNEASFVEKGTSKDTQAIQRGLDRLVVLAMALTEADEAHAHATAAPKVHYRKPPAPQPVEPPDPELAALAASLEKKLGFPADGLTPEPIVQQETPAPDELELPAEVLVEPEPIEVPEVESAPIETPAPPAYELPPAYEPPPPFEPTPPFETAPARPEPAEAEPVAPPPIAGGAVAYAELRADLFETSRMSYEAKDLFEATYAGRTPTWTGKLERLSDYNTDMVFEGGPGTQALVALEPIQDGSFTKDVHAIVQLTREQAELAKPLVGTEVTLTGKLVSCDGFMRKLFLADGRVTG